MATAIEKKLADAGYSFLGKDLKIESLILEVLKTGDNRYLKALPYLIYKHKVDPRWMENPSDDRRIKEMSKMILIDTFHIFKEFNIPLLDGLEETYGTFGPSQDYKGFRDEFELQLRSEKKPFLYSDKQKIYAERDLQMQLSRIFTKKERHILKRLMEEKPISKTDYEYYSRKTKKKINSIIGLQDFARTIFTKAPGYDEDLYSLKRWIENSIKKNGNGKIALIRFYQSGKSLSLHYREEDDIRSGSITIGEINDKKILDLLTRYPEHDFT